MPTRFRFATLTAAVWDPFLLLSWQAVDAKYSCDESKCRAERTHPWVDDDTEYTCWVAPPAYSGASGEVIDLTALLEVRLLDPEAGYCADGYVGRLVTSVPMQEVDGELRYWFTCCPLESEYSSVGKNALEVYQTCTDTDCSSPDWANGGNCWADGFQEPLICDSPTYRYPRFTGMESLIYAQFLCCTSSQTGDSFMDQLRLARIIWVTLSSITLLVCITFIAAILTKKSARSDGYNLYLVFLAAPDALANLMILLRNALTMPEIPISPTPFLFLASFEYFYAAANMWLNAVIVAQIYKVLRNPNKKVKIPPPSTQQVCKQASIVYLLAGMAFGWALYLYIRGLLEFSLDTVVNVWIATRAVMAGPPFFFVLYVCYDVWKRNLLPIVGRTRVLALYFLRVIVVFLLTWVPYFILYEIAWNITYNQWMVHTSYYLGSVQGTVSVLVALGKPDVKQACLDFVRRLCGRKQMSETAEEDKPASPPAEGAPEEAATTEASERAAVVDEWYKEDVWATMDIDDIVGSAEDEKAVNVECAGTTLEVEHDDSPSQMALTAEQERASKPVDGIDWVDRWYKERLEKRLDRMGTANTENSE